MENLELKNDERGFSPELFCRFVLISMFIAAAALFCPLSITYSAVTGEGALRLLFITISFVALLFIGAVYSMDIFKNRSKESELAEQRIRRYLVFKNMFLFAIAIMLSIFAAFVTLGNADIEKLYLGTTSPLGWLVVKAPVSFVAYIVSLFFVCLLAGQNNLYFRVILFFLSVLCVVIFLGGTSVPYLESEELKPIAMMLFAILAPLFGVFLIFMRSQFKVLFPLIGLILILTSAYCLFQKVDGEEQIAIDFVSILSVSIKTSILYFVIIAAAKKLHGNIGVRWQNIGARIAVAVSAAGILIQTVATVLFNR